VKRPIIAWIVDDEPFDAKIAWEAVTEVSSSFEEGVRIYWAATFSWNIGPELREAVDLTLSPVVEQPYPDVVIMDLCYGSQVELLGDSFHRDLRNWEVGKESGRLALVVLWSIHQGKRMSERFVEAVVKGDPRVIPLASKQKDLLASKLRECWRRILEEREE
jgi:hypothetical protein